MTAHAAPKTLDLPFPKSPKPGETIERDGIHVEILASDEMRVEQVRLSQIQLKETPESVGAEE